MAAPEATVDLPTPSVDDLYILYTGEPRNASAVCGVSTTSLFRPWAGAHMDQGEAHRNYDDLAAQVLLRMGGEMSILMLPLFTHGAAQWAAFNMMCMGARIVIPDDVSQLWPEAVPDLAEREQVKVF